MYGLHNIINKFLCYSNQLGTRFMHWLAKDLLTVEANVVVCNTPGLVLIHAKWLQGFATEIILKCCWEHLRLWLLCQQYLLPLDWVSS